MLLAFLIGVLALASPPTLRAEPATSIRVDGVLDEAAWESAEAATGFRQFEPNEGAPATEQTVVRVLRTGDALVVGARLSVADPDQLRRRLSRRDDIDEADSFRAAFDSYGDGRTAYVFGLSAAGVQYDALLDGDDDDDSWDAIWQSAVRVTDDGWTVEMAIPYSQLRFSSETASWGLNFQRASPASGEESFWSPITRAEASGGIVRLFGRLEGMSGLTPRPVLQVAPYTLAGVERAEREDVPGTGATDLDGNLGADVKVGLSSNVTLDLTLNPDFGQVDADPSELNLSTFESIQSERRPFFVEGTQIFDQSFGGRDGALLYTRRIGAASPIVGAAKLTGRTAGGLQFGALASLTGDRLQPSRGYGAARVKQELPGQSFVGAGLTGYGASGTDGDRRAVAAAADWGLRFGGGRWLFEGTTAVTLRDDEDREVGSATYVGLDRVRGYVLPGFGLRLYSQRFALNDVGRFRQTDVVQARGGTRWLLNRGEAVGPFRRVNLGGFLTQTWTLSDGANQGLSVFSFTRADLPSFQSIRLNGFVRGLGGVDPRETRGLGPIRNVLRVGGELELSSDSRRPLRAELELGGQVGAEGERGWSVGGEVDWSATDRLALRANLEVGAGDGERAWAANESLFVVGDGVFLSTLAASPDEVAPDGLTPYAARLPFDALTPFDGPLLVDDATAYYLPLYGTRTTREADATLRLQYIFGPTTSLQLYAQLFAARGRYRDFRFLTSPEAFEAADDFPKRRDFAVTAFNANSVFRWEYRPGSRLFVVWSQGRGRDVDEEVLVGDGVGPSPFDVGTGRQFADAFGLYPSNVLLVKLSYLLMR